MDRQWVKDKLRDFAAFCEDCGDYDELEPGITEYAVAIAAQHEAEIERLRTLHSRQFSLDIAKMAALAGALRAHDAWMKRIYPPSVFTGVSGDEGVLEVVELRKQAEQALQSAPEVVYYDTFKAKGLDDHILLLSRTGDAEFRTTDGALDNDGQMYDLLILAREQAQESEQPDAQGQ